MYSLQTLSLWHWWAKNRAEATLGGRERPEVILWLQPRMSDYQTPLWGSAGLSRVRQCAAKTGERRRQQEGGNLTNRARLKVISQRLPGHRKSKMGCYLYPASHPLSLTSNEYLGKFFCMFVSLLNACSLPKNTASRRIKFLFAWLTTKLSIVGQRHGWVGCQ